MGPGLGEVIDLGTGFGGGLSLISGLISLVALGVFAVLQSDTGNDDDGARCLVDPALMDRCSAAVDAGAAVIAAAPVTDTIKRVDAEGVIQDTPDRSVLWGAQTPQGFPVEQLRQAHAQARQEGWSVTDDASLFERLGWPVRVMESSPSNIKITTPFDLTIAEAVLSAR